MTPTIVVFKWRGTKGYRSDFSANRVNILYAMMKRHYPQMERFLCITDDHAGLRKEIEYYPLWDDWADIPNPTWKDGPSCFRRLKIFDPAFEKIAGPRFCMLDIDVVPVADLTPLFERTEDFVIWRPQMEGVRMCASMVMMDAGAREIVLKYWDPKTSPDLIAQSTEVRGSDQGWIQFCLGDIEAGWTRDDGVYSFRGLGIAEKDPRFAKVPKWMARTSITKKTKQHTLPENARMVIFTGKPDPWDPEAQALAPWLREHYRA